MRHRVIAAVVQIRHARARADARADGSAVGREPADAGLLLDGDEIGHGQRAEKLLARAAEPCPVADDGQGCGDALVAGAGEDDDRQLTAAHARVAAGGGVGSGLGLNVAVALAQKKTADLRAPFPAQPFLGDGGIARDLRGQNRLQQLRRNGVGELHDAAHVQHALVLQMLLRRSLDRQIEQDLVVMRLVDDIGMAVADANAGPVLAGIDGHADVEHARRVAAADGDRNMRQKVRDPALLVL